MAVRRRLPATGLIREPQGSGADQLWSRRSRRGMRVVFDAMTVKRLKPTPAPPPSCLSARRRGRHIPRLTVQAAAAEPLRSGTDRLRSRTPRESRRKRQFSLGDLTRPRVILRLAVQAADTATIVDRARCETALTLTRRRWSIQNLRAKPRASSTRMASRRSVVSALNMTGHRIGRFESHFAREKFSFGCILGRVHFMRGKSLENLHEYIFDTF